MNTQIFLILGLIMMSISYIDAAPQLSKKEFKRVLAKVLKKPVNAISCQILSGASAHANLARCTCGAAQYVIKFFGDPVRGQNEIQWAFHAAELGIGSPIFYADLAGKYLIMECVQGNSLVPSSANNPVVITAVAKSLARLHNSQMPTSQGSDLFVRLDTKYKKLKCGGAIGGLVKRAMQYVERVKNEWQAYQVPHVPCHNDLNWGNILVDGDRVTFIDWGDAAVADPYYDSAVFLVLNMINPESEKRFFEQYDARLLAPEWHRYIVMCKQLAYLEFALDLLLDVQVGNSKLLRAAHISQTQDINFYLSDLAARKHRAAGNVTVKAALLYEMAVASLSKMLTMTI